MATKSSVGASYDEVPYPSLPLPQTDPDRLATVARIFGMQPAPIGRCRVLELGCAGGGNLIPMADRHPESNFVGVDLSRVQITTARQLATRAQLTNVEFHELSIMDIDESLGPFDYLIAHGLFAWVSHEVQEKVLDICRTNLAPHGVAYISYNAYPGWHLRGVLRELVTGAVERSATPRQRAAAARRVMEFFSRALGSSDAPYDRLLKGDFNLVLAQPDSYLLHEFFEDDNQPHYFFQFIERAVSHGLQYLGDATISAMFPWNFAAPVEQNLMRISPDVLALEQHMDLLRNQPFRQTILCRDGVPLERRLDAQRFTQFFFASQLKPKSAAPRIDAEGPEEFRTPSGAMISTPAPGFKAVLLEIGKAWPRAISFDDLARVAASAGGAQAHAFGEEDRGRLARNLMQGALAGAIDVHTAADPFVTMVSQRPCTSRLTRVQGTAGVQVTNRRHETIVLDNLARVLLSRLDGQNDHNALVDRLVEAVGQGELPTTMAGISAIPGQISRTTLAAKLNDSLARFAVGALLVS